MAERTRRVQFAAKKLSSQMMVALLIVALIGFLGLFLWQALQIKKMQDEYDHKKVELAAVQDRNNRLQEHLDFYKGPGYMLYVEMVAREALGMAKPGETVVLTVPDDGTSGAVASSPNSSSPGANAPPVTAQKKPNWRNWLDFFIGQ